MLAILWAREELCAWLNMESDLSIEEAAKLGNELVEFLQELEKRLPK